MLLFWLLLAGGSQKIKAQNETIELQLKQHRDAWVCGSEGDERFIISVSIGEVKSRDSLGSIQVWFTYNPDKLMFINILDKNTLAEFFEVKGMNDALEPGLFTGYATTMTTNYASGNKPLIAFEVKFLGDCSDTAHINLDDIELDKSKSFWNRLNYKDKSLIVNIETKETENSFVDVSFLQDTLRDFTEDSITVALINLNTNNLARVDSLDFEIRYKKNENYEFEDFDLLSSNTPKMVIDSVAVFDENDTTKIRVKSHLLEGINDETVMQLLMKQIKKENDTVRIDMKVSKINECTCATSFIGDKVFIVGKKDDTTSIVIDKIENKDIDIHCYYNLLSDEFVIKTLLNGFKEIVLYDVMGRMIEDKENMKAIDEIRIPAERYLNGIYLVHIKLLNNSEKNIVLIKN